MVLPLYKWCHRIAVIIPDCLSGDRGSIPRGIAKGIQEPKNLGGFGVRSMVKVGDTGEHTLPFEMPGAKNNKADPLE